jgi:hypothetical protein
MFVLLWLLCAQTLRRQVQHSRDRCLQPDQVSYVQELQLQHLIGKGGFGTVFRGTWQGSPVAFKVCWGGLAALLLLQAVRMSDTLQSCRCVYAVPCGGRGATACMRRCGT